MRLNFLSATLLFEMALVTLAQSPALAEQKSNISAVSGGDSEQVSIAGTFDTPFQQIIDLYGGIAYNKRNAVERGMLFLSASKSLTFDNNARSITPYAQAMISPGAQETSDNQNSTAVGVRLEQRLSERVSAGVDCRRIFFTNDAYQPDSAVGFSVTVK